VEIQREENDSQTFEIIGAAMEVHSHVGHGFLEAVYQEALAVEFSERGVPFGREVDVPVYYKGRLLSCSYRADFVCFGEVIVELKAISELTSREESQVMNYLRATGMSRALILNFGRTRLVFKRMILSKHVLRSSSSD
jgi:GxxExxY protein